ncbi:DUF4266 domain-containing protein [Catenovulum sediminis]|uniref:DUF4266 domain-containing protein n=1 Tax=Catenovulum sediminis TaxID=1740262 RepID=A0ABV1RLC3_9ALTE|nr:DUF4266 domain-containing protein [Catenovulum sediminis]
MQKQLKNLFVNKLTVLALIIISVTGCAQLGVEPWVKPYERQNLADPIMLRARHPIALNHEAHVYEARESARGAEGTGGGGCGCN